jgi:3-oxoacyl-[acyl-carrier protein] reductase
MILLLMKGNSGDKMKTSSQKRFQNKVVLITGSSKGIGKATAILFAKEGAKVIINYSKSEKEANETLLQVKKLTDAIVVKCDVSDEKQVEKMIKTIVQKFGRIDILVNNAGYYFDGDEWNGTSDIWEKTLKTNLISVMNVSKYVAQIFQKQKSGIIVNVSSSYSIRGHYESLTYAASKAGVVNVTQAYARLLSPYGRANAVSPRAVRAGYWLRAPKEELKETIAISPAKRLIEPEEVAEVILTLASDKSSKITGQNVVVDGLK